jgi:hypothetical protein
MVREMGCAGSDFGLRGGVGGVWAQRKSRILATHLTVMVTSIA